MTAFGKNTATAADRADNRRQELGVDEHGREIMPHDFEDAFDDAKLMDAPPSSTAVQQPQAPAPAPSAARVSQATPGQRPNLASRFLRTPPSGSPASSASRPSQPMSQPAQRPPVASALVSQRPVEQAATGQRPALSGAPAPSSVQRPTVQAASPGQRPAPSSDTQRPVPQTATLGQRPAPAAAAPSQHQAPRQDYAQGTTPARPAPSQAPRPSHASAPAPQSGRPAPASAPASQGGRPSVASAGTSRPLPARQEEPIQQQSAPASIAAATSTVNDLFSGYTDQVREKSRRPDGLPLRLERLIDEISDFDGVSPERREGAKIKALHSEDREKFRADLMAYYRNKVVPARRNTATSLEDAQSKNPGKAVFLLLKGKEWTAQVLDPNVPQERAMALLNGASVEVVSSSRTPFPEPSVMFGRKDAVVNMEVSEDLFNERSELPSRAPRP